LAAPDTFSKVTSDAGAESLALAPASRLPAQSSLPSISLSRRRRRRGSDPSSSARQTSGTITTAGDPRVIQIAVKLQF